jgi:hypothetical protein
MVSIEAARAALKQLEAEFKANASRIGAILEGDRIMVHKIRWFVWAGDEMIPRTAIMRGTWGYDVKCSCGWESKTGGALERYVRSEVELHKQSA